MKRKTMIYLFFLSFLLLPRKVGASPVTYTRTETDFKVPSDVEVTEKNHDTIMNTPSVSPDAKIYDFADLFTEEEEQNLYKSIKEYIDDKKVDAIIVTTNNLNGYSIKEYAYNFYDYNDFQSVGVIFVIYKNVDHTEIYMGNSGPSTSKIFKAYNDARIRETLKYVYDNYLREEKYYECCQEYIKIINGFYDATFGKYHVNKNGQITKEIPWIESLVIAASLSFIVYTILKKKYQNTPPRTDISLKRSANKETMIVKEEYDKRIENKEEEQKQEDTQEQKMF